MANNASLRMGGEAALPVHYFRVLRQRQFPVWLLVHSRNRNELQSLFPNDIDHILYTNERMLDRFLWSLGRLLPHRINLFTIGLLNRICMQTAQRRQIRFVLSALPIRLIHQPAPVSPKEPSLIYGVGAHVVMGPLNGGIDYPPGVVTQRHFVESLVIQFGRRLAPLINRLFPGKREAALLLAANQRTQAALKEVGCPESVLMPENGVDLSVFRKSVRVSETGISDQAGNSRVCRFIFLGRLVDWKAVDLLLQAFQFARELAPMTLTIVGDGSESARLQKLAGTLSLLPGDAPSSVGTVQFTGWLSQPECARQLAEADALILPSLMECGGAVVLEAMAMSLPVIATKWGGPTDYLDDSCGILVEPSSRKSFIQGLADAMVQLAGDPQRREQMGAAGRKRVEQHFDWECKVDQMIELYHQVISKPASSRSPKSDPACACNVEIVHASRRPEWQ